VDVNNDVDLSAFDIRISLLYAHRHGMSNLLLLAVICRSGHHNPGRAIHTMYEAWSSERFWNRVS
jgi:hypothetical protein